MEQDPEFEPQESVEPPSSEEPAYTPPPARYSKPANPRAGKGRAKDRWAANRGGSKSQKRQRTTEAAPASGDQEGATAVAAGACCMKPWETDKRCRRASVSAISYNG